MCLSHVPARTTPRAAVASVPMCRSHRAPRPPRTPRGTHAHISGIPHATPPQTHTTTRRAPPAPSTSAKSLHNTRVTHHSGGDPGPIFSPANPTQAAKRAVSNPHNMCAAWVQINPQLGKKLWITVEKCGPNVPSTKLSTGCAQRPPIPAPPRPHTATPHEQQERAPSTQPTGLTTPALFVFLLEEQRTKTREGRIWGQLGRAAHRHHSRRDPSPG